MKYRLMLIALLLSTPFCNAEKNSLPPSFGVWSEWLPYSKLPERFPFLLRQKARLHVAVKEDEINQLQTWRDLTTMMSKAKDQGVQVWIWPLLSKGHGYWLNQWNNDLYAQYVEKLIRNLGAENLKPAGVSMDLEPPPEKLEEFLGLIRKFKISEVIKRAKSNIDLKQFEATRTSIGTLARTLHGLGIRTHAVTTPFVLEDSSGKRMIQKIFGSPLDSDHFDHISFMAYRSEFERMVGNLNPRIVYEYSRRAILQYGNRAGIDLGVVGDISFPHEVQGYQEPSQLHEDISAARAAGISRIQAYSLDGMDDRNWFKNIDPKEPCYSLKFQVLDQFLKMILQKIERE